MNLANSQKKHFKTVGHHLSPVVMVAEKGLTENLVKEASRALADHELIKIRFSLDDRDERRALMQELAEQLQAELVQVTGKIGLYFKKAAKPNPKLSNLIRFA